VSLYKNPPPQTHVLCLDEMGPLGAKLYFGQAWSEFKVYPKVVPNYGGKGILWVFGALEPQTGQVFTMTAKRRRGLDFLAFLDVLVAQWPEGKLILIMDNLNVHKMLDVRLWALSHERVSFLFQPTYAPWLNLIEPWWKTLRNLALKGRSFQDLEQMALAIQAATSYWNEHRHPYVWRKAA
jgi:transposase